MGVHNHKILSSILTVAILAVLGCLGYVVATPKAGEKFTEFYILGIEGKAKDYPRQVVSGKPIDIIVGIVNREHEPTSYRVEITIDSIKNRGISVNELAHQEKWQEIVSFTPEDKVGSNQKVEFWLYKNGEIEPYFNEPLGLLIDVTEP